MILKQLMHFEKLKELVANGESSCLEFKKSTTQLKAAFETLCGFLNNRGGTVLLGVTDQGKIVGQEVSDATRQEIAKEIHKLEPPYEVTVEYIPVENGKEVIALHALELTYPPYIYDGRAYQRIQSTTVRMPQHQYEQLLIKRGHLKYAWDESSAVGYNVSDLDHEEIYRTLRQGIAANRISESALNDPVSSILERLKLVQDGALTNAAVVLYAKEVWPNYPQLQIMMARFRGTTKTAPFIDNQSFYGNAFQILNEASNFIRKHLFIESFYQEDSFERIDKPTLPVLAVREALINSICHRDYSNRSSHIALAIYDDRLELWNYGKLPNDLRVEDLSTAHHSNPRNKLIASTFYSRGFVEKWGTGTTKMIDMCREHGIPDPIFKEYSGGFSVTFTFKDPLGVPATKELPKDILSLRQQEIVSILKESGPLSPKMIGLKLKDKVTDRTLRHDLAFLKKLGMLNSTGRANSTVWFVQESQEGKKN